MMKISKKEGGVWGWSKNFWSKGMFKERLAVRTIFNCWARPTEKLVQTVLSKLNLPINKKYNDKTMKDGPIYCIFPCIRDPFATRQQGISFLIMSISRLQTFKVLGHQFQNETKFLCKIFYW